MDSNKYFNYYISSTSRAGFTFSNNEVQLRSFQNASRNQNIISIIHLIQDNNLERDRSVLINDLQRIPYNTPWTDDQKNICRRVCNAYDIAARLIKYDDFARQIIIEGWGGSMVNCYKAAEQMIQLERAQRPERWKEFVDLAETLK